jgi:hypothetical protein
MPVYRAQARGVVKGAVAAQDLPALLVTLECRHKALNDRRHKALNDRHFIKEIVMLFVLWRRHCR